MLGLGWAIQIAVALRLVPKAVGTGFLATLGSSLINGNVLLTGAEKEELGILVFDVTSAPASFVAENPDTVAAFLAVTAEMNAGWNDGSMVEEMIPVIAKDAGMEEQATRDFMATFKFPSIEEQLSEAWLGGNAQQFMLGVAGVFVESGSIPAALETYESNVNTGPLMAAAAM